MKSAKWVVKGVNEYQYQVSDGQYIREVNLQTGTCECRKWQLSGLPCGHVIAVTRFLGLTDCVQYVSDWFKKPKYQGTYSESIHFLGNMQQWEFPQNIQKAIPPRMDNPQPGRPKNTKRIQSQGEEPRVIHCSRCTQAGHRRDQCNKPFVVEPPVNIRTQNDQEIPRNNQPSFYDPNQQYDNTFHTFNQYTSQYYGDTTYPSQQYSETPYSSQPYDQHFTNTSQAYDGHHTESSQMYEQYNSQQYDAQHLDDLNTNGSNAQYKLEIYIDHIGVNFVISKYIFPNASLAEMMNHVITDYSSENEDIIRKVTQNDYTFDQMVEWAEQEHFEDEETNVSCLKTDISSVLIPNNGSMEEPKIDLSYLHQMQKRKISRQTIVSKLQREIQDEETLAQQLLSNLNRYSEEMRIRQVQITMLQSMPTTSLNTYGLHALLMTLEADICTTNNILRTRQQLLRSISAKQNFINSYMAL
ncbi:transposase, MuDR, MULE transposase domain protein [Tanacetum coccineum]